jgi:hypothetical protein
MGRAKVQRAWERLTILRLINPCRTPRHSSTETASALPR